MDPSGIGVFSGMASTRTRPDGSISGATIAVSREQYIRRAAVLLHELGHCFGLDHLMTFRGMMDIPDFIFNDFTDPEKAVLRMMQYRKPGNRWPDDARPVARSLAVGERLVCVRAVPLTFGRLRGMRAAFPPKRRRALSKSDTLRRRLVATGAGTP